MRGDTMEAKLDRLAEIVADGQQMKRNQAVGDARQAEQDSLQELLAADTPANARSVPLPSERV